MCENLLTELHGRGEAVIPLDWQDNPAAREIAGRCEVIPGAPGPGRSARWHAGLLRRIRRAGIAHDVLLVVAPFPLVLGEHPHLCQYVHDLHMLEPGFYQPGKRTWFRAFLGRSLAKAARLISVSDATRTELARHYPKAAERAVTVHLWSEAALGQSGPALEAEPYFLAVGQFERRKNLVRLLDAFAAARRQGMTTELRLCGRPGPGGRQVLERIAAPDIADAVHVHRGPTDAELGRLYRGARALLFPSLCEGFGLPLLEAMQAGLPILTSDRSSMPEVAGDAALLVDPLDVAAIERGILRLDGDRGLREDLARRGRARLARFAPGPLVDRLLGELRDVAGA